jgi:hypothetical protein
MVRRLIKQMTNGRQANALPSRGAVRLYLLVRIRGRCRWRAAGAPGGGRLNSHASCCTTLWSPREAPTPELQQQLPLQEGVTGWVVSPRQPVAVVVSVGCAGDGSLQAGPAAHADHRHASRGAVKAANRH